jgi:hypothetical protein
LLPTVDPSALLGVTSMQLVSCGGRGQEHLVDRGVQLRLEGRGAVRGGRNVLRWEEERARKGRTTSSTPPDAEDVDECPEQARDAEDRSCDEPGQRPLAAMFGDGIHNDLGARAHEREGEREHEVDASREAPRVLDLGFP